MKYVCTICGWVYDEDKGCEKENVAPKTKFDDLPESFECPLCHVSKEFFEAES